MTHYNTCYGYVWFPQFHPNSLYLFYLVLYNDNLCTYSYIHIDWNRLVCICTSSTAQGGGGSFKNRKPIGEVGCCESGMAERSHWWTERCLRSPLFLSLSLSFLSVSLSFSHYLPTYWSICLPIYLSVYLSPYLSIYLPIYLAVWFSSYLSIYLPIYLSINLSIYLSIYLSVYLSIYLSIYPSISLSLCLSVSVCLCLSLSVSVCLCLSLSVSVCLCLSLSVSVCLCLSLSVSVCLSVCLSVYLSTCLSASLKTKLFCEMCSFFKVDNIKNAAILRDFLNFWTWQRQKRNNFYKTSSIFCIWQHQNQSNSASRPAKMESWMQRWQPRTNAFCDFSSPPV